MAEKEGMGRLQIRETIIVKKFADEKAKEEGKPFEVSESEEEKDGAKH